jgi:hypothetical protein
MDRSITGRGRRGVVPWCSPAAEADPTPGVSDLHPGSSFVDRAAADLSMWLRGGEDYLREHQWLRGSAAGEIIVMPHAFYNDRETP